MRKRNVIMFTFPKVICMSCSKGDNDLWNFSEYSYRHFQVIGVRINYFRYQEPEHFKNQMNGLNYSPSARKHAKRVSCSWCHFNALSSCRELNVLFLQYILMDNYYNLSDKQLQLSQKLISYPWFCKVLIWG